MATCVCVSSPQLSSSSFFLTFCSEGSRRGEMARNSCQRFVCHCACKSSIFCALRNSIQKPENGMDGSFRIFHTMRTVQAVMLYIYRGRLCIVYIYIYESFESILIFHLFEALWTWCTLMCCWKSDGHLLVILTYRLNRPNTLYIYIYSKCFILCELQHI